MVIGDHVYDTLILGGGPAGISAALECRDSNVDFLVIERESRIGGQLPLLGGPIPNFAGGLLQDGQALQAQMEEVANHFVKDRILTDSEITSVDLENRRLGFNGGTLSGRTVLLATGYRIRKLPISVPLALAADVFHHVAMDESIFGGHEMAVVGGRDSAAFVALDLSKFCPVVHLIVRDSRLKCRPDLIARIESEPRIKLHFGCQVRSIHGDTGLERVNIVGAEGERVIRAQKLIIKIGYAPNTELFAGQVDLDDSGHVLVDSLMQTSQPGVFAAGDIISPGYARISTALGTAVLACRSIRSFLGHLVDH